MSAVSPIADAKAAPRTAGEHDPLGHLDPVTRQAWRESAIEWRRERDKREPLKRDLEAERRSLIRDFIIEALTPACNDLDACLLALDNDDDVAGAYHLRRVIVSIKHAAHGFRDLAA
jgi:hypothetical protein